jgi:protein-S-isoprenylcysteine O-methyltransferase Ste14
MSALVHMLRIVPLLAFAALMFSSVSSHRGGAKPRAGQHGARAPLVANLAAVALYVPALLVFSARSGGYAALLLAASGALLGLAGAAVVVRSRAELGPAWSFVPRAQEGARLVTTGPYRLVRHPIYSGFVLFAAGEAVAFGSSPAVMIVLFGMAPTFAWRARAEERVLTRTFGDRYVAYRQRTKMIIPHVF